MSETSFASLSPSLLARKGGAKPAMRPQLAALGQMTGPVAAASLEDLGWNDMGDDDDPHEAEVIHLTPPPHNPQADEDAQVQDIEASALLAEAGQPLVRKQQQELVERVTATEIHTADKPAKARVRRSRRSALDRGERAAFTLRLDAERHLKLRLACAIRNRSAQQLVTEALDTLLGAMTNVDSMAAQVKRL